MNLNKIGKALTSKSVGTGPSSYGKRIYRAAISQRLRNTWLKGKSDSVMPQSHTGGAEVYLHSFSNSALGGVVNFIRRPLYHRGNNPGTYCTRGWVDPRVGLDASKKRKISCPYRVSNPGSSTSLHSPLYHV